MIYMYMNIYIYTCVCACVLKLIAIVCCMCIANPAVIRALANKNRFVQYNKRGITVAKLIICTPDEAQKAK